MRTKSFTKKNSTSEIICTAPGRLTKVKSLPNYEFELEFIDGMRGFIEMGKLIVSKRF